MVLIGLLLEPTAAATSVIDRVAAVVNDEVISLSEVYELGGPFIERRCPESDPSCVLDAELEIVDVQVRRALIRQELDRLGLQITAEDVDRAIEQTVQQYQLEDRAALRAEVERQGQAWDQYREELFEYLRTQAFQGRVLAPRVTVNDDEVLDRFTREARRAKKPEALVEGFALRIPEGAEEAAREARIEEAQGLVDQINAGELAWAAAVTEHDEVGVATVFGRKVVPGELKQEFDDVIFGAEPQVAIRPLVLGDIVYVLSVRELGERDVEITFEDAKENLRGVLFQEKLQVAEEEWYQRTRREAAVDIKLKP